MLRPNNLKCGGKRKHQDGGKIDMSQFYNQPVKSPFPDEPQQEYANKMEEGLAKGILDIQREEGDSLLDSYTQLNQKKTPATPKNWSMSLGTGVMALNALTGEIAGRVARNRQNQYDYMQQSALGQMNPMPVTDYQPNPYSLYAKYGGNLKTYMKYGGLKHVDYFGPPFSNGATMKMGDEDKMDVKAAHSVMSKMLRGFKKGGLTPNKAREILHDGTAQGHPLTDKQRRFFGAKSKGHTNYRGK